MMLHRPIGPQVHARLKSKIYNCARHPQDNMLSCFYMHLRGHRTAYEAGQSKLLNYLR